MSFGSAIVLEAGKEYSLRLVLKAAGSSSTARASAASPSVKADLTVDGGTSLWSTSFGVASTWETFSANFTATATTLNATLSIYSTADSDWWLGSVSLTPTQNTWCAPLALSPVPLIFPYKSEESLRGAGAG